VGTKVLDKEETAVPLDIQNGFNDINDDIPGKQDGIIKTEYPAVKVKAEPQSSGEKRVIEELVTPNGSRKRKSSSTFVPGENHLINEVVMVVHMWLQGGPFLAK
jgi:hypothetical protein